MSNSAAVKAREAGEIFAPLANVSASRPVVVLDFVPDTINGVNRQVLPTFERKEISGWRVIGADPGDGLHPPGTPTTITPVAMPQAFAPFVVVYDIHARTGPGIPTLTSLSPGLYRVRYAGLVSNTFRATSDALAFVPPSSSTGVEVDSKWFDASTRLNWESEDGPTVRYRRWTTTGWTATRRIALGEARRLTDGTPSRLRRGIHLFETDSSNQAVFVVAR